MSEPFQKTPPKSSERIRAMLEAVRRDDDRQADAGPHREGLPAEETLVIASFRDQECGRRYQALLLREGIMSQARVFRTYAEVLVDYSDRQRAGDLLETHLAAFPDRAPETWRRDYDFTIFGTVLGATLGVIILSAEFRDLRFAAIAAIFTLLGAICGSLLDRPRNRYRRTGQIQFGLGDILVLTAVVALCIALARLLNAI